MYLKDVSLRYTLRDMAVIDQENTCIVTKRFVIAIDLSLNWEREKVTILHKIK